MYSYGRGNAWREQCNWLAQATYLGTVEYGLALLADGSALTAMVTMFTPSAHCHTATNINSIDRPAQVRVTQVQKRIEVAATRSAVRRESMSATGAHRQGRVAAHEGRP
jgi:hypothetical protein